MKLTDLKVLIKGGGDLASGVAWRLQQSGFKVLITEIEQPLAVRRTVSFCEAVYEGRAEVEGVEALLVHNRNEATEIWMQGHIAIIVDPRCESSLSLKPDILVDAIIAKENLGTEINDAPLVIALGPGFEVGRDAHFVVETNRGHKLGRLRPGEG